MYKESDPLIGYKLRCIRFPQNDLLCPLDRTMCKFDPTGVQTYDLLIMNSTFYATEMLQTTKPSGAFKFLNTSNYVVSYIALIMYYTFQLAHIDNKLG